MGRLDTGYRFFAIVIFASIFTVHQNAQSVDMPIGTGHNAVSSGLSIGAGGMVAISPYKSYDMTVMPVPLISYDSKYFYAKGAGLGVNVIKNERHKISLGVSYHGMSFDPDKTDDASLKLLDKRRSTMTVDAAYSFIGQFGVLRLNVNQDILGRSSGTLGTASWYVPIVKENFTLLPGIGIQWSSANYNDYYYGVSNAESARSGLSAHKAGNAFTPYATVGFVYKATDRWSIIGSVKGDYLTGKIKDSPMVGRKFIGSVTAGVQFSF